MLSDVSNSLPPATVELACWMIRLSVYTPSAQSLVNFLIGPENGGRNSLRIVGHQLLFSHGESRITVLSTQRPWQWPIQNKKTYFSVLKQNNGVEFKSLLRSSAAARKLRRLVHRAAHTWRHWLLPHIAAPTACQLTKMMKSKTGERLISDRPE